jgi:ABC-type antimicrobial peptide transport system permease subunit
MKAATRGSKRLRRVQGSRFKVGAARVICCWLFVIGYLGRCAGALRALSEPLRGVICYLLFVACCLLFVVWFSVFSDNH